ncbi:uncharacterized protein DUF4259 [Yoonia maricola]|uniref:Uncharacterized protein DUF4259 n=1 Tax=Yoonia maricola TaxID=420999 RepID=A0A2M8W0Y3_9RHOB|nr:DUF4259 domain-containing protein [Yoonia maricola]PJI84583.1 uncharacterized protein DUF4259 [Yoonia maricola]
MGARDVGQFGNDTALDFAAEVKTFADVCAVIEDDSKFAPDLDADDASIALAACEMLATAIGRAPEDLPEMTTLGDEGVTPALLETATGLIIHIRSNSELAALWQESEENDAWQASLDGLLARLDQSKPFKAPAKKAKQEELPEDFIGYCYICYGMVTERDGLLFEYDDPEGGSLSNYPHRKCIEDQITEPGPYWNDDGSPTPVTRKQLMRGLGYEI